MTNINPVDLQTLGARVTDPAQLTEGRWYAVRTNCEVTHNLLVHAQYLGSSGSLHRFDVAKEDFVELNRSMGLVKVINRDSSSIRTGKTNGGGVCEVFKFKRVVDGPVSVPKKSPYSTGNCRDNGIKEGDKFVVVSDSGLVSKGTIVTLTRDDGSHCPYFEVTGCKHRQAIYLWRLAPVSPTGRMQASAPAIQNIPKPVEVRPVVANQSNASAPAATLSTVDQFKSEIDALRAKVQQKRDQIAELSEEIAGFTQAIEDTREKLKASLDGYI